MDNDLWTFPDTVGRLDVTGFQVEAVDGSIGKVDESATDTGGSYLVVNTGVWKFGRTIVLPAGLVDRVDRDEEKLYVAATKDDIDDAPAYDEDAADYRSTLGEYYLGRRNVTPNGGGETDR